MLAVDEVERRAYRSASSVKVARRAKNPRPAIGGNNRTRRGDRAGSKASVRRPCHAFISTLSRLLTCLGVDKPHRAAGAISDQVAPASLNKLRYSLGK